MRDIAVFCLFGGAALSAALSGLFRKTRPLWALLSAVCMVCGVLAGLALGRTPGDLLTPALAVCAAAMASLLLGRGGGGG